MVSPALLIPLLLGCDMGAADGTLLTDVQVVHVGAEPPEVAPGEHVDVVATVVDPLGEGARALVWPCTDLGEGCLEDQGQPVTEWATLVEVQDEDAAATVAVDPALAALLAFEVDGYTPAVGVWVLACRTGVCPVLDTFAAGPAAGSAEEAEVRAVLQDPEALVADLPLQGASLARRSLPLTTLPVETRNANPVLTPVGPPALELAVGQETLLQFDLWDDGDVSGDLSAYSWYGFATLGGISPARATLQDGSLTYVAGEEAGEGRVYVVVLDGLGGSGLWRGDVVVE